MWRALPAGPAGPARGNRARLARARYHRVMAWAAPSSEREDIPDAVEAMLGGRKSPERLYWRLHRPRASVYARRARQVLLYRAAAAAAGIIAIALGAFVGMVLGNIGNPRWPPAARIGTRTVSLAVVHAVAEFPAWMPAFIVLGVILAIIPRPRSWIFGLTVLGAGALGYCLRFLPEFHPSALASAITERTAAATDRLRLGPQSSAGVPVLLLLAAIVAGYACYRYSYGFAARSTGVIPRRPVTHYRSTFAGRPVTMRLTAVPLTMVVLTAVVWIAEGVRAHLPGVRYEAFLFGDSHPSVLTWLLAALIVAWVVCMPHPNGLQWLFIVLLLGLTGYAFFPHVYLIRLPADSLLAGASFWGLVFAYLGVAGFGYSAIAAVLDWR
jgi:hypothetical protein